MDSDSEDDNSSSPGPRQRDFSLTIKDDSEAVLGGLCRTGVAFGIPSSASEVLRFVVALLGHPDSGASGVSRVL